VMVSFNPFAVGQHKLWNVGWATYFTLRTWLMVLAFALPLVLWWGGAVFSDLSLQGSISAYYHAGDGALRDVFVGALVAVAALLIVYKGFSGFENWALNVGGGALIMVALIPDDGSTALSDSVPWLHGSSAIAFFLCLGYVAFVRSGDTLGLMPDATQRRWFRWFYRGVAAGMLALVALAALVAWLAGTSWVVFVIETGGVWAFATYWYLKTLEVRSSGADAMANRRLLRRGPYSLRDFFKVIPVEAMAEGQAEGVGAGDPS